MIIDAVVLVAVRLVEPKISPVRRSMTAQLRNPFVWTVCAVTAAGRNGRGSSMGDGLGAASGDSPGGAGVRPPVWREGRTRHEPEPGADRRDSEHQQHEQENERAPLLPAAPTAGDRWPHLSAADRLVGHRLAWWACGVVGLPVEVAPAGRAPLC